MGPSTTARAGHSDLNIHMDNHTVEGGEDSQQLMLGYRRWEITNPESIGHVNNGIEARNGGRVVGR